jgi:hypothetical protein
MSAALKPRAKELMCCGSRSKAASSMAMYGAMPAAARRQRVRVDINSAAAWSEAQHGCRH